MADIAVTKGNAMVKTIFRPVAVRLGSIVAGALGGLAYASPELLAHIEAAVAGVLLIAVDIALGKRSGQD